MGLLDEARAAQQDKVRRVHRCAVVVSMEDMDEGDATDLEVALGDATIDAVTLSSVLRTRGLSLSQKQIQNHRGGRCACAR